MDINFFRMGPILILFRQQFMYLLTFSDSKNTSMREGLLVFEQFVRELETTWKGKLIEQTGKNTQQICYSITITLIIILEK